MGNEGAQETLDRWPREAARQSTQALWTKPTSARLDTGVGDASVGRPGFAVGIQFGRWPREGSRTVRARASDQPAAARMDTGVGDVSVGQPTASNRMRASGVQLGRERCI